MSNDTIRDYLSKIENREVVLPEFQREFTWRKEQTRTLLDSLVREYPVGSILTWTTKDVPALKNMPDFEPENRVEVLLDGQQRLTALYMLVKDGIPPYYRDEDIADSKDPRELYYHLSDCSFRYYNQIEMQANPLWVSVTSCFSKNPPTPKEIASEVADEEERFDVYADLETGMKRLLGILDRPIPVMHVHPDAVLREALLIFDRTNSNGTPLSEADIALAHMCSAWPDTRRVFKSKLATMEEAGFSFKLSFLIRAMNVVINDSSEFKSLHANSEQQLISGWTALNRILDYLLSFLKGRAHIYTGSDINSPNALLPVIAFLARNGFKFRHEAEARKAMYWLYAALYRGRYSGSVDSTLGKDLNVLKANEPLDNMIALLSEEDGSPTLSPSNFDTRGVRHPLYNMVNVVIRARGGVDWANGLSLADTIGNSNRIENHHVFPKAILRDAGFDASENPLDKKRVHEIANRVPLTRDSNMEIFDKEPAQYLPKVREANPGNLKKFMVPEDDELWDVSNYREFLDARRRLLAEGINGFMEWLLEAEEEEEEDVDVEQIVADGENDEVEFKSTLRWHIYAKRNDKEIEHSALKTIAAFLNTDGGTLIIGVDDDGEVLGLSLDGFPDTDKLMLHLTNLVRDRIGTSFMRFVKPRPHQVDGETVLVVDCEPSVEPAYVQHDNRDRFYIRTGPSTSELPTKDIHGYVQSHFYDI